MSFVNLYLHIFMHSQVEYGAFDQLSFSVLGISAESSFFGFYDLFEETSNMQLLNMQRL